MRNCSKNLEKLLGNSKPQRKIDGKDKPYSLRLPAGISFSYDESLEIVTIHILNVNRKGTPTDYVSKNMQTDAAAFEGWSLVLKSLLPDSVKVRLVWEESEIKKKADGKEDPSQRHYNRFLYRACRFQEMFDWFTAEQATEAVMPLKSGVDYILNVPSKSRSKAGGCKERATEGKFANAPKDSPKGLCKTANISEIGNQLPVGVFEKNKKGGYGTRIFTCGASAIDLWGVNSKERSLSIFELKEKDNEKVGCLSELFFYSMVMRDLADKNFTFKEVRNIPKGLKPWPPKYIKDIEIVHAYLLAPLLHPLFGDGERIFEILNDHKLTRKTPVSFGYISFTSVDNCTREIPA